VGSGKLSPFRDQRDSMANATLRYRHGSPAATQGILIPVNLKMRNHSHLCGE
jgi:hypothetical protein